MNRPRPGRNDEVHSLLFGSLDVVLFRRDGGNIYKYIQKDLIEDVALKSCDVVASSLVLPFLLSPAGTHTHKKKKKKKERGVKVRKVNEREGLENPAEVFAGRRQ